MTAVAADVGSSAPPRRKVPAWRIGLALGLVLLAGLFVAEAVQGRLSGDAWKALARDLRIAVFHCVAVAYVVAAWLGVRHALARLAAQIGRPADAFTRTHAWHLVLGAVLGTGFALAGPFLSAHSTAFNPWLPASWSPEVTWHRVLGLPLGFGIGVLLAEVGARGVELGALARTLPIASPYDRRGVDALGRAALTLTLWPAGLFVVGGLLLIERDHWVHLAILTPFIASVGLAALAPTFLCLRLRLLMLKEAELERLTAAIAPLQAQLLEGTGPAVPGRYADLLASRTHLLDLPDWPFDRDGSVGVLVLFAMPALSAVAGVVRDHVGSWLFGT